MESPVRICLGATVVVNLLFLCSAIPEGSILPSENTTSSIVNNDKPLSSRYSKANGTSWVPRGRTKNNELSPKDSSSEEQSDGKNAKYKDRGRVRYRLSSSTSTFKPRRLIKTTERPLFTSTERPEFTIVTPTPQKRNITEVLDSMREYKRTKLPISSTTARTVGIDNESNEDDDYEDENEYSDHEGYKTTNFHPNNFFTIPGFDDDFLQGPKSDNNVPKKSYSIPSYDKFSSYFPKDSYSSASNSANFYDLDLTTPRNTHFDKKFKEISNSIQNNLAAVKSRNSNSTNQKILKNNFSKGIPTNKSSVFITNTKEIRLLDNEEAGSDKKELSGVHGTSIYYETSVLSTETYFIDDSNEDDCDNDTTLFEPTPSTSSEEENASINAKHENSSLPKSHKHTNTYSTNNNLINPPVKIQSSSTNPLSTTDSLPTTIATAETSTNKFSSNYRNREYSKRINFSNNREYSNSVTVKPDQITPASVYKPVTRRMHYPTPKTIPIWMTTRRNYTRPSSTKTTLPNTIYAEHFNIRDAVTPKINKTYSILTTVSSNIDPILQSDVGSSKKVVHSQSISDNSIPHLRKRGSMKYTTTASSAEVETETSQDIMDIPSTAWALAGLRPSLPKSPAINISKSTPKSVDDNELQNVDEPSNNKEVTTSFTKLTTKDNQNTDYPSKNVVDVNQNKLVWKPANEEPTAESEIKTILQETKTERMPAESNISFQSSIQPTTTEAISDITENREVSSVITVEDTTEAINKKIDEENFLTKPTNATAFESITKLPSGITTPKVEETIAPLTETSIRISSTELPKTPNVDDFEVTTIRFTYIPTILDGIIETTEQPSTTDIWHPVTVDTTKIPITEETIVTTYRPKYLTTTDKLEETPTIVPETTTMIEKTTSTSATFIETQPSATTTTKESVTLASIESTPHLETSTVIVKVVTEINTERETRKPTTTMSSLTTEQKIEATSNQYIDTVSEENSGSNEVITHVKETTTQDNEEDEDDMTVKPISKSETEAPTDEVESEEKTEEEQEENEVFDKSEIPKETTTLIEEFLSSDSNKQSVMASTTDDSTTEYMTTEASSQVLDEAGSGAAVAIAVSTIGVIALILLVGLLLVVRKRGRRGVYAQRCTPVSLDAYSLDSVSVGHRKGNHRLRASKRSYGNPAYDDEVTSHPMTYAALANFALDVDSMTAEFAEIPTVNVRPEEVPLGCEDKNRYSNVLPLPETRVPLQRIGNDPTTEYINANYVTGPGNIKNYYIACQAPLPNTVVDFWRMIWEQNSRLIVMLTEYMENGVEKCYEYLPPSEISDNKRTFGNFQIILQKRELRDKYAISTVQLFNLDTRRWREVSHLWYFWPAKGIPDDYDSIIDFLSEMRSYMKISQNGKEYDEQGLEIVTTPESRSSFKIPRVREDLSPNANVYSPQREELMRRGAATNGTLARMKAASETEGGVRPCVAVCSTGAGRAGLVLALDECARALAAGQADVPRAVRRLRSQRPQALANKHHYMLLYKVLSEYGNKLMGGGVDGI